MPRTTTDTGPNLTRFTYLGRQTVKYGLILIVTLMVGRTLFNAFSAYWASINPPPPPPPTVGFGILPDLVFPNPVAQAPSRYRLETPTGTLPEFGDRAKVFLIPQPSLNLLSDQRVREIASQWGFVFTPQVLGNGRYRWTKSQPLESTLEITAADLFSTLTTDFLSRGELVRGRAILTEPQATQRVRNMLRQAELLTPDIATGPGQIRYLKSLSGELQDAVAPVEADFVQVDIARYPIDGVYQMYSPEGTKATVHAIVADELPGADSVVQLEYRHVNVDDSFYHTYPLKSVELAWQQLQAGEGYVASNFANTQEAVIREVVLGYFDSFELQPFLQPVYVFQGDGGFIAYVPALDPSFLFTPLSPTP